MNAARDRKRAMVKRIKEAIEEEKKGNVELLKYHRNGRTGRLNSDGVMIAGYLNCTVKKMEEILKMVVEG